MLEDDFPPDTAEFLKHELEKNPGKCYYDPNLKRVVYHSDKDAMEVYLAFQCSEMEKYKWIESQKAHHDLGEAALIDWDRKYAPTFAEFWRKTHSFISSKKQGCRC